MYTLLDFLPLMIFAPRLTSNRNNQLVWANGIDRLRRSRLGKKLGLRYEVANATRSGLSGSVTTPLGLAPTAVFMTAETPPQRIFSSRLHICGRPCLSRG
jgi:hypothetical protein